MLVMVIISGLNIYPAQAAIRIEKSVKLSQRISKFIFKNPETTNDFSFANEAVPMNDARVTRKLQHSLFKHNFNHVQSNILFIKAERLFPIIEPILKAYGIPDDFKYIALVESGFGDGASIKGAKGLWQFMPGTARTYGLKVGHGYDERMNVRKSTNAACRYIRELYGEFSSWTLAAAAYNNGSIKMARAINRQNEDNYFRMHLNRETGTYIYNVIAMKAIVNQPQKYGYDYYKKLTYYNPGSAELLAIN